MGRRAYYKSARQSKLDATRHDDGHSALIPKSKIGSFLILFNRIKDQLGTYKKTKKEIRLPNTTTDDLRSEKRLTAEHAKRILTTYNKLFNNESDLHG